MWLRAGARNLVLACIQLHCNDIYESIKINVKIVCIVALQQFLGLQVSLLEMKAALKTVLVATQAPTNADGCLRVKKWIF